MPTASASRLTPMPGPPGGGAGRPALATATRAPIQVGRTPFIACLAVSLLLHAALALPFLVGDRFPAPARHQTLTLELFGMVSDRQIEQQLAKVAARAPQRSKVLPAERLLKNAPTQASSPVQLAAAAPPVQATQETPAQARPARSGADEERLQQTVRATADERTQMRLYLIELTREIQSKMVYPAEARAAGYMGTPKLRFTIAEDGAIVPGTLVVEKSSGYAELDQSALRATLAAAPFGKPPHRISPAVSPVFSVKN
jgi:protein TonB